MAMASLAAVAAVQAQDTGTMDNTNATVNYNYNVNTPAAGNDNANSNANANVNAGPTSEPTVNANLNTNTEHPLPPPGTTARPPVSGTANPTTATGPKLMKIPSPDYVKYFREVRKIGDSLYGILMNGVNTVTGNSPTAKPRHVVTADESACVVGAITAKDQAIMATQTAEATGFNSAVAARTACQTTALASTDGQGAALEKCAKDFRTAAVAVRDTLNKAQKDAWATYTTALKTCVAAPTATNTNTTSSSEIMIEDGGNSL